MGSPASLVPLPYSATLGGTSLTSGTNIPANPSTVASGTAITNPNTQGNNTVTRTTDVSFTIAPATPIGTPTASTGYTDTLLIDVYDIPNNNTKTHVGTLSLTLTATVSTGCTITTPRNTRQVIAVGPTGLTTGAVNGGTPTFTVTCGGGKGCCGREPGRNMKSPKNDDDIHGCCLPPVSW